MRSAGLRQAAQRRHGSAAPRSRAHRGAHRRCGGGDADRRRGRRVAAEPERRATGAGLRSPRATTSARRSSRAPTITAAASAGCSSPGLAVEGAVLVAVAFGRPAPVRRRLDRLGRRPVLGAAAAGAGVSLLTTVATLPVSLISHERAVDVGLSTQSLGSWLWDVARSAGITAVLTAGGAALLIALVRRFPRGLAGPRRRRRQRPGRGLRLDRAGRPGADLQQVRAAAGLEPSPRGRAGARPRGRGRHRRGLPDRRQPPVDRAQRLRRRDRLDQAGRPLRQPARAGRPPRAALDRRPRARPRRPRRRPARDPLRRPRGPARAAVRPRAGAGDRPRARAPIPRSPGGDPRLPARPGAHRA